MFFSTFLPNVKDNSWPMSFNILNKILKNNFIITLVNIIIIFRDLKRILNSVQVLNIFYSRRLKT